jgi:Uma2 family endonuclease
VGHLWLLDPDQRTLEVYQNAGGHWLLLGVFENEDEVTAVPFDAIAFNLGGLWAD